MSGDERAAQGATQSDARAPGGLNDRQHVLDTAWFALFVALSITVGVVAYADPVRLEPAPLAWSLFGYGVLYAIGARRLGRAKNERLAAMGTTAAQHVGILMLGFLWFRLGGMQNPALLFAFAIPIVGGAALSSGWSHYGSALLCVAVVGVGTLLEAPDLRWYLAQVGLPIPSEATIAAAFGSDPGTRPFADVRLAPGQRLTLFVSFAFGLLTLAVASDALRLLLDRLARRAGAADSARAGADLLAQQSLRASVAPALLVYSDTGSVIDVSDSFETAFDCGRAQTVGRNLFEVLDWSHPDMVEELMRAGGGEAKATVIRVGARVSIARIHVRVTRWQERDCAIVTMEDQNAAWLFEAAFDSLGTPVVLVGPDGRIAYASPLAREIFPDAHTNQIAGDALRQDELPDDWWRPEPLSRRDVHVPVPGGPRRTGSTTALRFPGEREAWLLLSLAPEARRR